MKTRHYEVCEYIKNNQPCNIHDIASALNKTVINTRNILRDLKMQHKDLIQLKDGNISYYFLNPKRLRYFKKLSHYRVYDFVRNNQDCSFLQISEALGYDRDKLLKALKEMSNLCTYLSARSGEGVRGEIGPWSDNKELEISTFYIRGEAAQWWI